MSDKQFSLIFLVLLTLVLVAALPFAGSHIEEAYERAKAPKKVKREPDQGHPIRLVTVPLFNSGAGMRNAVVAVIDLPARSDADRLCGQSPYLNDALQSFAADYPNRTDPTQRIPGTDPVLAKVLKARFPEVRMEAVRLIEPTAYMDLYPSRDVYECRGLSYQRVAVRTPKLP